MDPMSKSKNDSSFEAHAGEGRQSFLSEFADFLMDNKKWWMLPILFVLLLVGVLLIVGGSGVAPFIYTLF